MKRDLHSADPAVDRAVLLLPGVLAVSMAMSVGQPMSDWDFARAGAEHLLSGHLTVYADMPKVQMGPLALLLAGVLSGPLYMVFLGALLPLVLWTATLPFPPTRRTYVYATAAGMLLAWPWTAFGVQGHADDALVAAGMVGMVSAVRLGRRGWFVVAFLVAVAAKPTAVLFLPLALLLSRRTAIAAAVLGGLVWAPFVLSDVPGFLAAGRGQGDLWPWSLPDLLGGIPHSGFPDWLRPVQLLGGLALCALVAHRRGPAAAVLAAVAFRVLVEPATWNYYSSSVVVAALVFDMHRTSRIPWMTLLAFVSFVAAPEPPLSMTQGIVRMSCLVAVLGVSVIAPARDATASTRTLRPQPAGMRGRDAPVALTA